MFNSFPPVSREFPSSGSKGNSFPMFITGHKGTVLLFRTYLYKHLNIGCSYSSK